MNKKVRIACVGSGGRGIEGLMRPIVGNENVEICGLYDKNEDSLNYAEQKLKEYGNSCEIKRYSAYEDLLNDSKIDAVAVTTGPEFHTDYSIMALDAGKHAISEIPAISSLEEAKKLKDAVKRNPAQKYMFAENCCFWSFVQVWKKLYSEGYLGDVWYAEAEYLHNCIGLTRDKDGNKTWRYSLPSIRYLTHDLGVLLYITDDYCISASGFLPGMNPYKEESMYPNMTGTFKTKKGALMTAKVFAGIERPYSHNYAMYGSKGSLETALTSNTNKKTTYASFKGLPYMNEQMIELPTEFGYLWEENEGHGGADKKMMEAFIKCILEDTKPEVDVDLGITMSLPGIYAEKSAKNGEIPVEIPEIY